MDYQSRTVELYTAQAAEILNIIRAEGCYYVKMQFIERKYQEVKGVFLSAYQWYGKRASFILPKPGEAESAVWTFLKLKYVEAGQGTSLLRLKVPIQEAVFFRMSDWNKILNFRYLGKSPEEEEEFSRTLEKSGISYEGDVFLTPYYPLLKRRLLESWDNLFRYDQGIKEGGKIEFEDMQAGLWCIRREWLA